MGEELYNNSSAARAVFHEVDMALGRPLTRLLFEGPDDTLRQTVNAQPAIMTVSLATMRAMQDHLGADGTPRPALVAGHSLGEYTALAVAGVLDVGETAWLVQERGRLMQEACEKQSGSMAAVMGLDAMVLEQICRETAPSSPPSTPPIRSSLPESVARSPTRSTWRSREARRRQSPSGSREPSTPRSWSPRRWVSSTPSRA